MNEIELLEGLLQRYSPTLQEAEATNYLVAHMKAAGFEACVDEVGNAVGVLGEGPREIMMLGHIDTVPGFIEVKREDDRLYGRGAVDAKGPLACFAAAAALAGAREGYRFVVIGAVGEEGDSRGALHVRDHYRPNLLIIGEPSSWDRVTLGYKGSAWFEYEVKRTLAHTSANVESACQRAVNFWNRLMERSAQWNVGRLKMFDQLIPSLRRMHSTSDGFVETAQLKFNLRVPLGLGLNEVEAMVREQAVESELHLYEGCPAYRAEKNTPLVRSFLAAIRWHEGTPSFTVKSGTSDMNLVAPAWQCPTVAYGPGDSDLDHTPHEHILISEYQRAIRILADVLKTV
ncbi:MAG TPA: [LysW]-lysine hydrolase [Anaerolineae bacterium]|nr:[LysW]-lysine hydrolase [Anaerolineae bacterium]